MPFENKGHTNSKAHHAGHHAEVNETPASSSIHKEKPHDSSIVRQDPFGDGVHMSHADRHKVNHNPNEGVVAHSGHKHDKVRSHSEDHQEESVKNTPEEEELSKEAK